MSEGMARTAAPQKKAASVAHPAWAPLVRTHQCATSGAGHRGAMTTETFFGHRVVVLSSAIPGRLRSRGAQVLLAVLAGEVEVALDEQPAATMFWGDVLVVTPGHPWGLRALNGPARLLVVAQPGGAEGVVAALCEGPTGEPQSRLALALDQGVELLL